MGEAPQMPVEAEVAPVAEVHEGQGAMFGEVPAEVPAAEVAPVKVDPPTKPPADKAGPITELVMGARADTVRKAARELFREHGVKAPASLSKKEIARALESSGIPYEGIAAAIEGRPQDAGKPLLESYTEAEVAQREASQKQAEQQTERAKAREAAEVKQREEQAAVRQRSEQAAETFELGQSAEDNLSGQANIFDAQPEVQPEAQPFDGWESNLFKARDYANKLGLDYKGKSREQIVDDIKAHLEGKKAEGKAPKDKGDTSKSKSKAYGAKNKVVSRERAELLRERLKSKLTEIRSGFDPEMLAIGIELSAFHIEA